MSRINKEKQAVMPQKLIKELLDYDGVSGSWVSKVDRGTLKVGQPAGSVDKNGYIVLRINGDRHYSHRLAWTYAYGDYPDGEQPYIDHVNGIPSDNRIENLRINSHGENMRNKRMRFDNTSGVSGVYRCEKKKPSGKIYVYWVAAWYDENHKRRSKTFNIGKLGEDEAKQMAIEYRAEQLHLLEQNHGIIYSERHGT